VPEDIVDRLFGELAGADLPVPARAAVIARGRQRRRRTRATAAVAAAAGTALVIAGASQLIGGPARTPALANHGKTPQTACAAAPDPTLTAELAARLPISRQVIALSADGTLAYSDVTVPGFHGIAEQRVDTGAIVRRIDALPDSYVRATGALSVGGELIWSSGYSTPGDQSSGSTPMRMWSPQTGVVTLEPPRQSGAALSAPVLYASRGKLAAWLQAAGHKREIVEANLGTGAVDVVATGYLGPPVFAGNALVWSAASSASGDHAHLVAMNAGEFPVQQHIAVPPALRSASPGVLMGSAQGGSWSAPIGLVVSNSQAVAYFSASLTELFYSPALTQPARLVLRMTGDAAFSPRSLSLGDGYLAWSTDSAASYVASTSSLAVATIGNGNSDYGTVEGLGGYVLASTTSAPKRGTAAVSLIRGLTIEEMSCARRGRPGGSK
jgi:hypothetical protein